MTNQEAIDARRYTFGNDEFSLEAAYHDCKLVFDGITDDDSFQEADTGLILYYANEIIYALQEALDKDTNVPSSCSESPNNSTLPLTCNQLATDCISRAAAIDAAVEASNNWDDWCKSRSTMITNAINSLPSVLPEPIRINLNEPIKVKLTDWGKEIYYHRYDRTNQIVGREICKPSFPREDENGYTEFQLWGFIELYGIHIGMTLPNVIEPLEIVYGR